MFAFFVLHKILDLNKKNITLPIVYYISPLLSKYHLDKENCGIVVCFRHGEWLFLMLTLKSPYLYLTITSSPFIS
jgi:hypothetical protein